MRLIPFSMGAIGLGFVALSLFERFVPRRVLRFFQKQIGSRIFRGSAGIVPGWAVIETTGRWTGRIHRVGVGGRLNGDSFWLLASKETDGRWKEGEAKVRPDDDPREHLLRLNPVNGAFLWLAGADLVAVRIDLQNLP